MQKTRQDQIKTALIDFYKRPVAKVSLEVIFSIIAVLFFAIFAIRPTLQTMSELIKEIEDKRSLDAQLGQKIASLSTAQSQYQLFSPQFYLLDEALPKTAMINQSLQIIEKIASDNELVIQSIATSSVPDELKEIEASIATRKTLTFNVSISGDYLNIRQFIEDVMASRRMMIVDQVNFGVGSSRYQKKLSAVIRINLPFYENAN